MKALHSRAIIAAGLCLLSFSAQAQSSPYSSRLAEWLALTAPGATQYPAQRYARFLQQTPDWPLRTRILWRYENALQQDTAPLELAQLCPLLPFTQSATLFHCRNYLRNRTRQARLLWRNNALSDVTEEQKFLDMFGTSLNADDHWQRYRNLEKKGLKQAASRQINRLMPSQRQLAQARFAQRFRLSSADALFDAYLDPFRNAELIGLRLRFLRQQNRSEEGFALWQQAAPSLTALPEKSLSLELLAYGRLFLHSKTEEDGQKALMLISSLISSGHPSIRHDSLFLSGYIQFSILHNPRQAEIFFQGLARESDIASKTQGLYWLGRCEETLGQKEQAQAQFEQASTYPTDFYGQLALARLTHSPFFNFNARNALFKTRLRDKLARISQPAKESIPRSDLASSARALARQGDRTNATLFITSLYAQAHEPAVLVSVAQLSYSLTIPKGAILAARKLAQSGIALYPLGYPVPYEKSALSPLLATLPPQFLPALIRQESSGDPRAISPSPAYGLMQLLLPTARMIARQRHLGTINATSLLDPQTNMLLGSFYASDLLKRFNGNIPYVLAAYNAGPGRVKMIDADPASSDYDEILLEWIIEFPFRETRSYISHIISDMAIYATLTRE